ncbi:MAG: hypothetical protein SV062_03500 [Thermodesulfobacteriota bacterium]|nr:hypothetical protein [Thermodesulfobacteriota bacterium]
MKLVDKDIEKVMGKIFGLSQKNLNEKHLTRKAGINMGRQAKEDK